MTQMAVGCDPVQCRGLHLGELSQGNVECFMCFVHCDGIHMRFRVKVSCSLCLVISPSFARLYISFPCPFPAYFLVLPLINLSLASSSLSRSLSRPSSSPFVNFYPVISPDFLIIFYLGALFISGSTTINHSHAKDEFLSFIS